MSTLVSVDDLADAIQDELEKYREDVTDGVKKSVQAAAKQCRDEIKDNSPVLTGRYREGWRASTAYESAEDIRIVVHNKTDYQLTHLLEKSHLTRDGVTRTTAIPHIAPAEKHAAETLENKVKVVVRGDG